MTRFIEGLQGPRVVRGTPHLEGDLEGRPLIEAGIAHRVAHDIRSPLTTIQLCAEALQMSEDSSLRRRYAMVIAEQAKTIAWLLDHLVSLAREECWSEAEVEEVCLGEMVSECMSDLAQLAEIKGLRITTRAAEGRIPVRCLPERLGQALRACAQVVVSAAPAGSDLIASVEGAKKESNGRTMARVRFAVVGTHRDGETKRAALELPWHRLSLLAARRIVQAHGGTIGELEGEMGSGLEVRVATG